MAGRAASAANFPLLSLFARLPRAIYTSNNFPVTAQLHVTYQPLFPPVPKGDSSSFNYSIPVKFFSRSIDRRKTASRAEIAPFLSFLFSLFFPLFLPRSRRSTSRKMEMTPEKEIRKLSLDRNSERKLKNLSRFLDLNFFPNVTNER